MGWQKFIKNPNQQVHSDHLQFEKWMTKQFN